MNEQPLKFIVCGWNALGKKEGEGEIRWQLDPMGSAVSTYLSSLGHVELACKNDKAVTSGIPEAQYKKNADSSSFVDIPLTSPCDEYSQYLAAAEKYADLVVVTPRNRDKPFSLDELTVFHAGLGGKLKRVVYVHIANHSPFTQGRMSEWLFNISRADGISDEFKKWLDETFRFGASVTGLPFTTYYRKYISKTQIEPDEPRWPSYTARELIKSQSRAQFFYGLCRICKRYNRLEHDLNAEDQQDVLDFKSTNKKAYLDKCFDLHEAITACCIVSCRLTTVNRRSNKREILQNVVMLIDDHPERNGCAKNFAEAINAFLPGFEFWIWNTEAAKKYPDTITQEEIERHSSWSELDKKDIIIWEGLGDNKSRSKGLLELLARTRVVLVDILFQDAGGGDIEAGYGIIRGVQRLCCDRRGVVERYIREQHNLPNKLEKRTGVNKKEKTKNTPWELPEIIAVSRANDFSKAYTAYRCGASGYLMKERWLGLPGMIAASLQPTYDHSAVDHRNFRLLYNLPHQTLGMLRTCRVPRLAFHTGRMEAREKESPFDGKRLAPLLNILPKADIHVHPGSCMTPEYLVVASLIMLLRHDPNPQDPKAWEGFDAVKKVFNSLCKLANSSSKLRLLNDIDVENPQQDDRYVSIIDLPNRIEEISSQTRKYLENQIEVGEANRNTSPRDNDKEVNYSKLRSILHKGLGLPDHHDKLKILDALKRKQHSVLFFFALLHGSIGKETIKVSSDDLLRCFIIFLAAGEPYDAAITIQNTIIKPSELLNGEFPEKKWKKLHCLFYDKEGERRAAFGVARIRRNNWRLTSECDKQVEVTLGPGFRDSDILGDCPKPGEHPIAWLLASGTRSTNLEGYLDGCEFSGAEHIQHPFLMHLFAQQAINEFIRHGVLYAELRTALSGYENAEIRIPFADACNCFCAAMGQAQEIALSMYQKKFEQKKKSVWLWKGRFTVEDLFNPFKEELARFRFPCKVSVILTGKRHKSSRMLVREAGAGAVLYGRPQKPANTARDFVEEAVRECRVVGFDLAGQEDQHHPQKFRTEYEQIARLHIPVTVHAGENAPADFVESAILDLRARRLGHGLALVDDKALMERARDDGICIELCPVSNFQTNAVYPPKEVKQGREYPLKTYLDAGLRVTINTDNPIISHTNMIKECFQASYAYGAQGLTLWELLHILRMGFTQSFLTQPERRALLELVDQIVFDLFSRPDVINLLHILSSKRGVA